MAQSFGCGTELEFVAQSFGFAAFKKAGKFYFLQSSQNIRERGNQLFRRVVFPSPYLFTRNFVVSGCS